MFDRMFKFILDRKLGKIKNRRIRKQLNLLYMSMGRLLTWFALSDNVKAGSTMVVEKEFKLISHRLEELKKEYYKEFNNQD